MVVELADLRSALDNNEVVPCFQPLVELGSGRLVGFEVLARWQHPQHGPVLPDNFITLAEKNDLIWQLTQQVIGKTFLSLPSLGDTLVLAINVSPVQLRDFSLPSQIRAEADRAAFPMERLTIEITESAFLDNLEKAKKIADRKSVV